MSPELALIPYPDTDTEAEGEAPPTEADTPPDTEAEEQPEAEAPPPDAAAPTEEALAVPLSELTSDNPPPRLPKLNGTAPDGWAKLPDGQISKAVGRLVARLAERVGTDVLEAGYEYDSRGWLHLTGAGAWTPAWDNKRIGGAAFTALEAIEGKALDAVDGAMANPAEPTKGRDASLAKALFEVGWERGIPRLQRARICGQAIQALDGSGDGMIPGFRKTKFGQVGNPYCYDTGKPMPGQLWADKFVQFDRVAGTVNTLPANGSVVSVVPPLRWRWDPYGTGPDPGTYPTPKWDRFIGGCLPSWDGAQEWLEALLGRSLLADTSTQIFTLLVGPAGCGKGTLTSILRGLLGTPDGAGVMSTMGDPSALFDKYFGAGAQHARLLLLEELPAGGLDGQALAVIKGISGEDMIQIRRMRVEPEGSTRLALTIWVSSNHVQVWTKDGADAGAILRRQRVFPLVKRWEGAAVPDLAARVLEADGEALAAKAVGRWIQHRRMAAADGRGLEPGQAVAHRNALTEAAVPTIQKWAMGWRRQPAARVPLEELEADWEEYANMWATRKELEWNKEETRKRIGAALVKAHGSDIRKRYRDGGKRRRGWALIRTKRPWEHTDGGA